MVDRRFVTAIGGPETERDAHGCAPGPVKAVVLYSLRDRSWSVLGEGAERRFHSGDEAMEAVEADVYPVAWNETTPGLWVARAHEH